MSDSEDAFETNIVEDNFDPYFKPEISSKHHFIYKNDLNLSKQKAEILSSGV